MKGHKYAIAGATGAVAVFGVFVALAQAHVIFVPFFTPAVLQVEGLREDYSANQDMSFTVRVDGYGSNCHMLQVEILNEDGARKSYYRKADDCRFMTITHGPYNFTKTFEYGGENVLPTDGTYKLDLQFEDQIDGTKVSMTRILRVQ